MIIGGRKMDLMCGCSGNSTIGGAPLSNAGCSGVTSADLDVYQDIYECAFSHGYFDRYSEEAIRSRISFLNTYINLKNINPGDCTYLQSFADMQTETYQIQVDHALCI